MTLQSRRGGVDPSLYHNYDLEDHIWRVARGQDHIDDLWALSHNIVMVGGRYWIYNPTTQCWNQKNDQRQAKNEAANIYLRQRLSTGREVTVDLLEMFFTGVRDIFVPNPLDASKNIKRSETVGSCPQMEAEISIPFGPKFVEFQGQRCLNIWRDTAIQAREEHITEALPVLRLIYRSLLSGRPLSEDVREESEMLLHQCQSGEWLNREHSDFRFFMTWLAALYQRPGINLMTNIWLVGEIQGVGKGTVIDLMKTVLGESSVIKLNINDIEKGWNNHLVGRQLVEVDEFDDAESKIDWDKWVKANTCEPTLSVSQRGVTAYSVINVSNFIFSTNKEDPIEISQHDRRNQFFKTTSDRTWVRRAGVVKSEIQANKIRVAQGFAAILSSIQLTAEDIKYINYAFNNEHKLSILENRQDPVTTWLLTDEELEPYIFAGGGSSSELYERYKKWYNQTHPNRTPKTWTAWGTEMGRSAYVEKSRTAKGSVYRIHRHEQVRIEMSWEEAQAEVESIIDRPVSVVAPTPDLTVEATVRPEFSAIERLRASLRQQMGQTHPIGDEDHGD